jgi:uncharacterized protein YaaQ
MKLIVAIVHERDRQTICETLLQDGQQFTVIATTGGFLRDGNTTLLIGADDDKVDGIITLLKSNCSTREQYVTQPPIDMIGAGGMVMGAVKVSVGGAIIFVVDVERFERV